ncbi:MAG: hypothetical protein ACKOW9_05725 [Candidatus Paceibacterota bacterium]
MSTKINKLLLFVSILAFSFATVNPAKAFDGFSDNEKAVILVRDAINKSIAGRGFDSEYTDLGLADVAADAVANLPSRAEAYGLQIYRGLYVFEVRENGSLSCVIPTTVTMGRKLSYKIQYSGCGKIIEKINSDLNRSLANSLATQLKIAIYEYSGKGKKKVFVKEDLLTLMLFISSYDWMSGHIINQGTGSLQVVNQERPSVKRTVVLDSKGRISVKA